MVAVVNLLAKEAVVVVDAVAVARHVEGGERVEEAGGEAPEAAVAEGRVLFGVLDLLNVAAEAVEGFVEGVVEPQIEDVVGQGSTDEKLHGEVVDAFGAGFSVAGLGLLSVVDGELANGEGDGAETIVGGERLPGSPEGVARVASNRILDIRCVIRWRWSTRGRLGSGW